MASPPITAPQGTRLRPSASEIDVFGLTHAGLVRSTNADHFLVASFHRALQVHAANVRPELLLPLAGESRGYMFLVADGVGGLDRAAEGSAHAVQTVARSLLDMGEVCLQSEPSREAEVVDRLRDSVNRAHEALLELSEATGPGTAATTLTMFIAIWPRAFVVHAGDSRCYRLRAGVLHRLTTDQTMAQALIDAGAMRPEAPEADRYSHVLVSAVGSAQLDPEVTVSDLERHDVTLLCSDGLTRHVRDDEIREHLAHGASAEDTCRALLALALERGGADNVTVLVGRTREPVA